MNLGGDNKTKLIWKIKLIRKNGVQQSNNLRSCSCHYSTDVELREKN